MSEVRVRPGDLEKLRRAKPEVKRDVYAQLLSLQGGKSDGWVAHKYRAWCGVWPVGMKDVKPKPATKEILNFVRSQNIAYAKAQEKLPLNTPPTGVIAVTQGWKEEAVNM